MAEDSGTGNGGSSHLVVIPPARSAGPGCLVRLLWYLFIGWWASLLWVGVAWLLIILILTMPLGLSMLNAVPMVVTLREPSRTVRAVQTGTIVQLLEVELPQRPFWIRALYFVVIGWWLSGLWVLVAWLWSLSLIGVPIAIWMFNRVPAVTTLRRY